MQDLKGHELSLSAMDEEASEEAESAEGISDSKHTPRNSRSQAGLSETGSESQLWSPCPVSQNPYATTNSFEGFKVFLPSLTKVFLVTQGMTALRRRHPPPACV
jgi:hypothetical protein